MSNGLVVSNGLTGNGVSMGSNGQMYQIVDIFKQAGAELGQAQ